MSEDTKSTKWFYKALKEYTVNIPENPLYESFMAMEESFLSFLTAYPQELFMDEDIYDKDDMVCKWIGYAYKYFSINDPHNPVFLTCLLFNEFLKAHAIALNKDYLSSIDYSCLLPKDTPKP